MRLSSLYGHRNGFHGLGQFGLLRVNVTLDGKPVAGADLEILFFDGSSEPAKTDASGSASIPYGQQQGPNATVRLMSFPAGTKDIGEDATQVVKIDGPNAEFTFALESQPIKPITVVPTPAKASMVPAIAGGLLVVGIIIGNVLSKKY